MEDATPDMVITPAEQVVADTVQAAEVVFGAEVEAVFTLGSLAHGGFAPLVSDVDVAIILRATGPDTAERVACVRQRVVDRASSPLARRVSIFWGDWVAVRTGKGDHIRLGPVDRLDLLESGRLLVGSDLREPSSRPSARDLVVMSADHILGKFTEAYLADMAQAADLVDGGVRAVTKAILFPVRFMYTLGTGAIGLNEASARWYASEGLPGGALALRALEWRSDNIGDPGLARQALDADLVRIHAACLEAYAAELDRLGEPLRAAAVADRAASIQVAVADLR